jgi:hypothetical protein
MTHPNNRLINEAREARTLSPEARTAKQAREDRAAERRAATERAGMVKPQCDSPEQRSPSSTPLSASQRGWPSLRRAARLGDVVAVEGESNGCIGEGGE